MRPKSRGAWIVLAVLCLVGLSLAAGMFLPAGVDWRMTFRPATLALISGRSPYDNTITEAPYAGAPWGLLPLIPLALLPESVGRGFLFVISLLAFGYSAARFGAKPVAAIAFLLSPTVLHCLINANLDWLPLLGYTLPPQIGLFFLAIKPQMGSVVALYWLIEAWQDAGWRGVLRAFAPFVLVFVVSLALFGAWPLNMVQAESYTTWWNASLWPASIPVGLALSIAAIRHRKIQYAMAASPCLSPHVLFHSWSAALIAIVSSTPETVAAVIGLWILTILRALQTG